MALAKGAAHDILRIGSHKSHEHEARRAELGTDHHGKDDATKSKMSDSDSVLHVFLRLCQFALSCK